MESHPITAKFMATDELVARFMRGELPKEEREVFTQHLINCSQCLNEARRISGLMNELERKESEESSS